MNEVDRANSSSTPKPSNSPSTLCGRKPTARPTSTMMTSPTALLSVSARTRPASTAKRAIGSERSRSMKPLARSWARAKPVVPEAKIEVCTAMPGTR